MRHRLTIDKSVNFMEEMAGKIQHAADPLNIPFQEIVRERVEIELPKLIERERKRTKRSSFRTKVSKHRTILNAHHRT